MQRVSMVVFSDYVCPWCYIGVGELERLSQEFELTVDWRPFYLRPDAPDSGWRVPEHIRQRMHSRDNPLSMRAASLGLTLVQREQIPSTKRAHQATEYARSKGALKVFHRALLDRYWSRSEDLSDFAVLKSVADEVGLDGAELVKEVEAGQWKSAVDKGVEAAQQLGVTAVPTFIVGEKFVLQGAQPGQVFRDVFAQLASGT